MVITLEHTNTDSGFNNVTYNHDIYETGYRYKSKPLGSYLDTDSHQSLVQLEKIYANKSYKLQLLKASINQNNSIYSSLGKTSFDLNQILFSIKKELIKIYMQLLI